VATIRERQPGVWEVRAFTGRDQKGRPTQVSRTVRGGKKDAQRVAAELTVRPRSHAARRTVADLLKAWLELNDASWAPSTKRDQANRAAFVAADAIGKTPIARLTVADVDRWHARLRKKGIGDASIRNQHMALRAALTQALRWGWLTTNVASVSRVPQPKQAPRDAMSAEEVQQVLAAAAEIDAAAAVALRLAAVCGARRAELAAFRWEDLDENRLTIDSAVATTRHGRRGAPQRPTLTDSTTKTANKRTVTIDDETVRLVEELRGVREQFGPWMFSYTEIPANPDRIGGWWRRARRLAGIDERWRLHDLRHWSATMAIGSGHDVRTVANRLGHANAAMTLRFYAHALDAADEAVANTIGDALRPATPSQNKGRQAAE
jgi:integrase